MEMWRKNNVSLKANKKMEINEYAKLIPNEKAAFYECKLFPNL